MYEMYLNMCGIQLDCMIRMKKNQYQLRFERHCKFSYSYSVKIVFFVSLSWQTSGIRIWGEPIFPRLFVVDVYLYTLNKLTI